MPLIPAAEIADGKRNLELLIAEQKAGKNKNLNEAETRFQIIDRIIVECLGWSQHPDEFHLETAQGRQYSDYELGNPRIIIWEAKREGKVFEIPVKRKGGLAHTLASVMQTSVECSKAIEQVNQYCHGRGVHFAVATNGHQIVAFESSKEVDPLAKCIVFNSLEHLSATFPRAWQTLSPAAVDEGKLHEFLKDASTPRPPEKLSAAIPDYPQARTPSDLQRSMLDIAELLLLNISEQKEIEKEFYKSCYCESGALSQHALISKQMLNARYHSLFSDAQDAPDVTPVQGKKSKANLTPEIFAEAISNNPIALIGDVGVGKSSFLKHLMYVSAFEEFKHAIYAYVNLGRKGALWDDVSALVLDQIENELSEKHGIDIGEREFVHGVYKKEVKRFEKSVFGGLKESNEALYHEKLVLMLADRISNKAEHLRHCIDYLSREKRKQIIIALDNADQRSASVQQQAFVIAQNLAADWRATVFISVRPRTFFISKRSGALSAYPQRVFTIAPPRIDEVINRRLRFALSIAEGKRHLDRFRNISFNFGNVATLIKVMLDTIEGSDDVKLFLENITGGNIRSLIEFIANMFGNPNVDLQGVVIELERSPGYRLPVHEFWKVALKGDYQYYDSEKALAANLFAVQSNDEREHFLLPMILGLLNEDAPRRSAEGFVGYSNIISELQSRGFRVTSIESALRYATNKKLIESPERITFEEDEDGTYGLIPNSFRINTVGAYHFKTWMTAFPYLDAMVVDTPVFDQSTSDLLRKTIRSFSMKDRYERTLRFRDYLGNVWHVMALSASYFDWFEACDVGQHSFDKIEAVLLKSKR